MAIRKTTPSSQMPKNAAKTTARKAYATAVANERKTLSQRMDEKAGSWAQPKIRKAKKGTTGSLKIAGQKVK